MTGTAQTEATEFSQIYNLEVISIPTNVPVKRIDQNDLIYKTQNEKFKAVIDEIKKAHEKGQPVLVGTASIERSEVLHEMLKKAGIPHSVLNAKNHEKEAEIIAQAGVKGAVTIATNMAGRGVDIRINDEVRDLGGLYIIGTERHESRRIDNQLRGRAGRQGDPGMSRFYLSLEDNLLRIFGSDRIKAIMDRLGIDEGESIESRMVTRAVENAQKKVESLHFEARKHLLEYDDVANEQRKTIYKYRDELLDKNYDMSEKIAQNRVEYATNLLDTAEIFHGGLKDDYDIKNLCSIILADCGEEIGENELKGLEYNELVEKIAQILEVRYNEKMSVLNEEQRKDIEKILYLQVLDNAWREHLYQMDILKTGIGLRGYNQKDPLVEYKKESYNLFMELVGRLKTESVKTLQVVRFKSREEQEEQARMMLEASQNAENEPLSYNNQGEEENFTPEKKIPRNAPCPCGSGKKYKDCHGKSGPKKGIFA